MLGYPSKEKAGSGEAREKKNKKVPDRMPLFTLTPLSIGVIITTVMVARGRSPSCVPQSRHLVRHPCLTPGFALASQVNFLPGKRCSIAAPDAVHYGRVSFAFLEDDELADAGQRLGRALAQAFSLSLRRGAE